MNGKKMKILRPMYYKEFRCIGPECTDTCCKGWRITIDRNTFRKYKKFKNTEIKKIAEQFVEKNPVSHSELDYGIIKTTESLACPFLNEKNLCKIQMSVGEQYLSSTCAMYPRIFNFVDGYIESSCELSCPSIAKAVLLCPDGIEFETVNEFVDMRAVLNREHISDDEKHKDSPMKYFGMLRDFSIYIIQNRNYKVWERMILLGLAYKRIDELKREEKIDDIPDALEEYIKVFEKKQIGDDLATISTNTIIQMQLMKELADLRYSSGISNPKYLGYLSNFLIGINYDDKLSLEKIGENYDSAYRDYYTPFMSEHEYILENYLVNFIFKRVVPMVTEKTFMDEFLALAIHYSLIKMHLIGIAAYHKGLNEDLVVDVIQSFSKTIEHSKEYLAGVFELMKMNQMDSLAYISILIKN